MNSTETNRFQDFFEEGRYIVMKNYLYNYLLRKRAVEKSIQPDENSLILEVGSGISPVMTKSDRIVYSDLSHTALSILKNKNKKGMYVAADATRLPFKPGAFTHTITSEVLEHLEDDETALKELRSVMKPSGNYIVTFPHRKFYFANDDRFVNHFRRYELKEMEELLKRTGFTPVKVKKVLGPLEKVTMSFIVFF
jgi:ubiquinone/menaquinone biosynthesis C-methylase UbiE